jgi:integrase
MGFGLYCYLPLPRCYLAWELEMPKFKLTEANIRDAKPGNRDLILWDAMVPGFGCKITPAGKKAFFLYYRTRDGQQRRPSIGEHGAIRCEQARDIARRWLGMVAEGQDPSVERQEARRAPFMRDLCARFIRDYAEKHSKPSYLKQQRRMIDTKIMPQLGAMKVAAVSRSDIAALHTRLSSSPYEANRVLALLSVIFRQAELWGLRPEGTNPCRSLRRYTEKRRERLLSNTEVERIHKTLNEAEQSGKEAPSAILAIRLLFATACRTSEVLGLRWDYLAYDTQEIVWPDNKAGGELRKPITRQVKQLLAKANRIVGNPYVCVSANRREPLSISTLEKVWRRILERAKIPHCGLHAIRHRAATDIANDPAIPIHVGMKLTGHRTVATFLRYHHAQREQVREAAEKVNRQRKKIMARPKPQLVQLGKAR